MSHNFICILADGKRMTLPKISCDFSEILKKNLSTREMLVTQHSPDIIDELFKFCEDNRETALSFEPKSVHEIRYAQYPVIVESFWTALSTTKIVKLLEVAKEFDVPFAYLTGMKGLFERVKSMSKEQLKQFLNGEFDEVDSEFSRRHIYPELKPS